MKDDFEILEPEDFVGGKQSEGFSFGALVMTSFRKAIENGSKEMKEGYYNTKFDAMGNPYKIWIPDSRKEFIETVETLRMLLERELDDEAKEELEKIDKELKDKYEEFCELEKEGWDKAPDILKKRWRNNGSFFREGMLSNSLPYGYEYTLEEVKSSRKIVKVLGKLVSRQNDFGEVAYKV